MDGGLRAGCSDPTILMSEDGLHSCLCKALTQVRTGLDRGTGCSPLLMSEVSGTVLHMLNHDYIDSPETRYAPTEG